MTQRMDQRPRPKAPMRPPLDRLVRAIMPLPFQDESGRKGIFEWFARAQPHLVRNIQIAMNGWPRWDRPLRVVFLSDFHTGSHSDDVSRLKRIIAEAQAFD